MRTATVVWLCGMALCFSGTHARGGAPVDLSQVAPVEDLGDKHFRVSARLPIEDLSELYKIEFDEDLDVDTVGGLMALELGRVPLPGAEVTWDGLRLRAEGGPDHRGRVRIGTVLVSPTEPGEEERE